MTGEKISATPLQYYRLRKRLRNLTRLQGGIWTHRTKRGEEHVEHVFGAGPWDEVDFDDIREGDVIKSDPRDDRSWVCSRCGEVHGTPKISVVVKVENNLLQTEELCDDPEARRLGRPGGVA